MSRTLVQYILIRKDLKEKMKWSDGAVVAQACHASIAAIHAFKGDPNTLHYLSNLKDMRKVVLSLVDHDMLLYYEQLFASKGVDFYTWVEQPENIKTCIASKPTDRELIKSLCSRLPLH